MENETKITVSSKQFIDETKERIFKYPEQEQNLIVKELLFGIMENRKMLIEQSKENTDRLQQLTSELPTFN